MDPLKMADLLYESEATLRLVDTALEEIRAGEGHPELRLADAHQDSFGMPLTERREYDPPSEFRVRAFWQVQEVAECIRESRELLRKVGAPADENAPVDERAGFDRILSLIDRLDPASASADSAAGDGRLFAELRAEVIALCGSAESNDAATGNVSLAISFLSEAEGRLTQLRNALDASA